MAFSGDRDGHFLVMLGTCCEDARLAGLPVRLQVRGGGAVKGVPAVPVMDLGDHESQIDDTGLRPSVCIGDQWVRVADIEAFCISRPGAHDPAPSAPPAAPGAP